MRKQPGIREVAVPEWAGIRDAVPAEKRRNDPGWKGGS
jgi:hypothetical protein